jgi:hypothetical protein
MITYSYRMNILIDYAAEDIEEPEPQPQPQMEPAMNYMNFELKWPTDVPPLEEKKDSTAKRLRVPVTSVDSAKSLPTAISLRIPGTAKNINIGCCTCNIS